MQTENQFFFWRYQLTLKIIILLNFKNIILKNYKSLWCPFVMIKSYCQFLCDFNTNLNSICFSLSKILFYLILTLIFLIFMTIFFIILLLAYYIVIYVLLFCCVLLIKLCLLCEELTYSKNGGRCCFRLLIN